LRQHPSLYDLRRRCQNQYRRLTSVHHLYLISQTSIRAAGTITERRATIYSVNRSEKVARQNIIVIKVAPSSKNGLLLSDMFEPLLSRSSGCSIQRQFVGPLPAQMAKADRETLLLGSIRRIALLMTPSLGLISSISLIERSSSGIGCLVGQRRVTIYDSLIFQ
jgi:hypothetical protein